MKNSKVKAARHPNLTAEPTREMTDLEMDLRAESERRQQKFIALGFDKRQSEFSTLPDMVAQSDLWQRNEPIPFGLDLFPADSHLYFMRFADLFYREAKGGPLYIDCPSAPHEVRHCEEKLKAYRAKGVRYTYIAGGDEVIDVLVRMDPITLPSGAV